MGLDFPMTQDDVPIIFNREAVEIILSDDVAIGIADNIILAIEQNEVRSAKIAAGMKVIPEPEI